MLSARDDLPVTITVPGDAHWSAATTRRGSPSPLRGKPHQIRLGTTPVAGAAGSRLGIRLRDLGNPATWGRRGWKQVLLHLHTAPRLGHPRAGHGRSICKATSVSTESPNPVGAPGPDPDGAVQAGEAARDIAEVPAVEVITTAAVHLMSAAAVKCGLAEGPDAEEHLDLDEARRLIEALAGLVDGATPYLSFHAAPVKDGLRSLQLAFREASAYPDEPGKGPGERYTGPVWG